MSDTGPAIEEPILRPRLGVWATVWEAYAIWLANLGLWLKLSIVPVVLLIGLNAVAPSVLPETKSADAGAVGAAAAVFILFGVIVYLSEIPLATAWHRFILTHDDTGSHRYLIGGREWRYLLKALLITLVVFLVSMGIGLLMAAVMIPVMMTGMAGMAGEPMAGFSWLGAVTGFFTLLIYAAIGYFLGHLFLMLPAAAVGRNMSMGETRAAARSNEWRLIGVYIVALLPIWVVGSILTWPVDGASILGADDLLGHVPALFFAPVIVGVVSISYRELVQQPETSALL